MTKSGTSDLPFTISHIPFKLNYSYYLQVFFENEYNTYFRSFLANKLATKLRGLINIYCQNLFYSQNPQKYVHDKRMKL